MASDEGLQNVTIRFHRPVDSEIVNKRFKDIRVLGIHKGGYLSKTGGDNVSLSPLVCEISDGTHQVRIETTAAVAKTLTELSPYLILNWEYTGVEATDYMEISVSSLPDPNDIIVGKGVFVASALSTIDYSERTTPDTHHLFLHVEQTETPGSSIRVRSGVGHASSVHYPIIDQVINISASSGQTVYVYVNDTGGVTHSVTAANYAGKALLAKIVYPADGIIENSDIEDVRSFITAPAIPDGDSIERDTSGKLKVKLQQDQVVGTSDITKNSSTYSDMAGMSITLTTTGGNVFVLFNAYVRTGYSDGAYVEYRLLHDGVVKIVGRSPRSQRNSDYNLGPAVLSWLATGLSAGSHTFKIQWRANVAAASQPGSSHKRVMQAIEFPIPI